MARLVAARVVCEVVFEGAYIGATLDHHLTREALTPLDRRFATALAYGTLTYWLPLTYELGKMSRQPLVTMSPYVQSVLALGAFQLRHAKVPPFAAINESVELAAYFAGAKVRGLVNAVLRRMTRENVHFSTKSPGLPYGWSNELFGVLRASYGAEQALAIVKHQVQFTRTTSIRLNRAKVPDELPAAALNDGVQIEPGKMVATARRLTLQGQSPVLQPGYREGLFSLQNESSQLAVQLVLQDEPQSILDLCAGNGGKTLAFAERMKAGSRIVSVELDGTKLARQADEQKRLGLNGIRRVEADATADLREQIGEAFDAVFCDVPCSGLGVVPAKPEIRLRMTYERIEALLPLQAAILTRASQYVRLGGTLFYATCTHNRQENESQVAAFLASHPDFSRSLFATALPAAIHASEQNGILNLFGYEHDVDGFFLAKMIRKA